MLFFPTTGNSPPNMMMYHDSTYFRDTLATKRCSKLSSGPRQIFLSFQSQEHPCSPTNPKDLHTSGVQPKTFAGFGWAHGEMCRNTCCRSIVKIHYWRRRQNITSPLHLKTPTYLQDLHKSDLFQSGCLTVGKPLTPRSSHLDFPAPAQSTSATTTLGSS